MEELSTLHEAIATTAFGLLMQTSVATSGLNWPRTPSRVDQSRNQARALSVTRCLRSSSHWSTRHHLGRPTPVEARGHQQRVGAVRFGTGRQPCGPRCTDPLGNPSSQSPPEYETNLWRILA